MASQVQNSSAFSRDFLEKEYPLICQIFEWNKEIGTYLKELLKDPSIHFDDSFMPLYMDIDRMYTYICNKYKLVKFRTELCNASLDDKYVLQFYKMHRSAALLKMLWTKFLFTQKPETSACDPREEFMLKFEESDDDVICLSDIKEEVSQYLGKDESVNNL